MKPRLLRLISEAVSILFPSRCAVCGQCLASMERCICTSCYLNLPLTHFRGHRGNVVERLFWQKLPIERASAYLRYQSSNDVRNVLFKLKYHDRPQVGRFFGRVMATELLATDFFKDIDVVVPLPLHRKKERKRGYNQSEHLARGVADVSGLPVDTKLVERVVNTPSQTRLTADERRQNMQNAFRLCSVERAAGRHILLVDDVLTTHATLLACGRALAQAPNVRISILVLALAGRHPLTVEVYEPIC